MISATILRMYIASQGKVLTPQYLGIGADKSNHLTDNSNGPIDCQVAHVSQLAYQIIQIN